MTYIFRKAHTRGEKGHNGKSLTSLTSLTELEHDWQALHPRRDRGGENFTAFGPSLAVGASQFMKTRMQEYVERT